MPDKATIDRANRDKRQGKSASTQAGEFVRAEIDKIREGKTGARSAKQAIAIGLSEARRAGVDLKPPAKGSVSEKTRKSSARAYAKGQRHEPIDATRSRASEKSMKREGHAAGSSRALSRQAKSASEKRGAAARSASASRAAATKGPKGRSRAAKKGARTRAGR
ncbi:MAG TPA: DUF6496 domain-containing protein [Puia sp.]|nr:DUF6496 domain-containing protein [Puia sp.]